MNTIIEQKKWRVSKALDMKFGEPHIPCRYGIVRQYDDGDLDVWVMTTRMAARLAKTWPVKKSYDDGALFIRPFSDLDKVCTVLRGRRKRVLSAESMVKLRERAKSLSKYRKSQLSGSSAS